MKNEFKVIADLIEKDKKVLDVGCSDGTLMKFLKDNKNINIRGLEISKDKVQFLLETIEVANDIDSDRAKASMQRSKDRLSNKKDNDINRAELSLLKALNRLKVSSR